jgi:hypothetical protein
MFGVSAANNLGFGLDLAGTAKLLANDNAKEGMACLVKSNIVISLIGHICRK